MLACTASGNDSTTGGTVGMINTLVLEPSWLSSMASKLIPHLFFTLLKLRLALLGFLYALHMVLSYCIVILNLASFSLLYLIFLINWPYTSYCYWKCILILWLGILELAKLFLRFKLVYSGLNYLLVSEHSFVAVLLVSRLKILQLLHLANWPLFQSPVSIFHIVHLTLLPASLLTMVLMLCWFVSTS